MPRSLKARIVLLVAVPTIIELLLVGKLTGLQARAEHSLQKAQHYTQVLRALNDLNVHFLEGDAEFLDVKVSNRNLSNIATTVKNNLKSIDTSIAELRALIKEDPEAISLLNRVVLVRDSITKTIRTLAKQIISGEATDAERKKGSAELNVLAKTAVTALVKLQTDVQELQYKRYAQGVHIKAEETSILISLAFVNAFFGIVAVFALSSAASKRLQDLLKNVHRYAANEALVPPKPGQDEIAFIEDVFYKAAEALRSAHRKEQAFIDESPDPIVFLSENLQINFANVTASQSYGMNEGIDLAEKLSPIEEIKSFLHDVRKNGAKNKQVEIEGLSEKRHAVLSAVWEPAENCYFCTVHDITERIQIEQMRSDLVSMFTHDLKSPLTALQLNIDRLAEGRLSESQRVQTVGKTQISLGRMSRLVFDLLDLYKTEAGMMQFKSETFDVRELVDAVRDELTVVAESLQVSLVVAADEQNSFQANADLEASRRVIANLLGNAIKFSPAGAEVTIGISQKGPMVEIAVTDKGPGITTEEIPRLFQRFRQLSTNSKSRAPALGSGLGLAICKTFAEKQGGRVTVNTALGEGSTFTFAVPSIISSSVL